MMRSNGQLLQQVWLVPPVTCANALLNSDVEDLHASNLSDFDSAVWLTSWLTAELTSISIRVQGFEL